ncbi:hypothetical protein [Thermus thalpophilus]|uniref:hypothetical protein n=1 Tax=Thermus thalpophilus TaxID=2908147 RepID=UPI001FA9DAC9|nr:hypothetical protein [Thermus thalpophilus]
MVELLAAYLLAAIFLYALLAHYVRARYGEPGPFLVVLMALGAGLLAVALAVVVAVGGGR